MLQQQDFLRKLLLMNEKLQVSSEIASVKQSFIMQYGFKISFINLIIIIMTFLVPLT